MADITLKMPPTERLRPAPRLLVLETNNYCMYKLENNKYIINDKFGERQNTCMKIFPTLTNSLESVDQS